jgi:hypothetical protein
MHVAEDDPRRFGFAYSPATEEQLRTSEAALGFPLPPLLHTLYAELANGGFGPGAGVRGIIGGYGTPTPPLDEYRTDETIVGYDSWHKTHARLIDLTDYADQWKQDAHGEYLLLPYTVWPQRMLALCDLGCCQTACLDGTSGQMFCSAPSENDELYLLWRLAPSLEAWLEQWLAQEPVP